ncbi:alpha/beta hydrolase [Solirubrobacter sp. CPCC 204708]|uniref:Alpha/beta hydrolase n=1 Tax=Solirubrobacter deserti TaxID=2282478 RepID=A0ABT4RMF6_9ACTN|nr:alpha/beta hydrolase [Solirubrobacter deserti]MBE2316735.1 alpha/beta hydrolase [Solirubrobacter deserti]MDA0139491.1 alpha/beta hydrolase [Solirubrobacter deserti]
MALEVADGLRYRWGGSGPVVLLLHGHPRTHTTWWQVAPPLVRAGFCVVCPDLPGYGESRRAGDQSKRAMAAAVAKLMERFGDYSVVGHDRGCYVAHRLAVSHGAARLVVLDGVPIAEALARCDARFAEAWWHWFFFAQEAKPAEDWIVRDPLAWYRSEPVGAENRADWERAVTNPDVVRAMVADYRAGLQVDRFDEEADREAGRLVSCPTLVGWSSRDDMEELYGDPVDVWRPWLTGPVHGVRIESGHHMAEEAPAELAGALTEFLRG